ncbi:hypothetical protein TNCV_1041071 [Trichonephila clavipes]|nr:hypothetical protein TNCV_1041071 [Trichonephila clavipes]
MPAMIRYLDHWATAAPVAAQSSLILGEENLGAKTSDRRPGSCSESGCHDSDKRNLIEVADPKHDFIQRLIAE